MNSTTYKFIKKPRVVMDLPGEAMQSIRKEDVKEITLSGYGEQDFSVKLYRRDWKRNRVHGYKIPRSENG